MKKIRIILSVALIALISVAWVVQVQGIIKANKDFRDLVSQADQLCADKLYQQAIQSYEAAIKIKDNDTVREKWISAYEFAYKDGVVEKKDYSKALNEMCSKQPRNPVYWEKLVELCVENGEYKSAYEYLNNAERTNVSSEVLTSLRNTVRYSYTRKNKVYTRFMRSAGGYYTLFDDRHCGIMDPNGDWQFERNYFNASPFGKNRLAVLQSAKDVRIINEDGVVEAILTLDFVVARTPNENIIPIQNEAGWRYFDYSKGEYLRGTYQNASSFYNGVAAVQTNGTWTLIDSEGKTVCNTHFDDVKLQSSGDFCYDGVMIASVNGAYSIYDERGNKTCDFQCEEMDGYLGGQIAYKDKSGKWGFVDRSGAIVIQPKYDNAKSFSSGLAGVKAGESWGFINQDGMLVIDSIYADVDYFTSGGIAVVSEYEGQYIVIKLRFPLD